MQRADAELLHRAPLLLAHDGERGGEHGGEHQDEAHEPGHEELGGAELGVVPDTRLVVDAGSLEADGGGSLRQETGIGAGHDRLRVAEERGRGVGVGPVHEELHARGAPRGEVARERLGDHEHGPGLPPLGQALEVRSRAGGSATRSKYVEFTK